MNLVEGAEYDFCDENIDIKEGPFEFFSSGKYDNCYDEAELICKENGLLYEAFEDNIYTCNCYGYGGYGMSKLYCQNRCTICNVEETVCGRESFTGTFSMDNFTTTLFVQEFEYVVGRDDLLSYFEYTDKFVEDLGTCKFFVNGSPCDRCIVQNCTGTDKSGAFTVPHIDCNVIKAGAVFDLCSDMQVKDGGFEFLLAGKFV
jgi:hypothetical protein